MKRKLYFENEIEIALEDIVDDAALKGNL